MKWGIQVNVGGPGTPDWRWLHGPQFDRTECESREEAQSLKDLWYPNAKRNLFRVEQVDEGA